MNGNKSEETVIEVYQLQLRGHVCCETAIKRKARSSHTSVRLFCIGDPDRISRCGVRTYTYMSGIIHEVEVLDECKVSKSSAYSLGDHGDIRFRIANAVPLIQDDVCPFTYSGMS